MTRILLQHAFQARRVVVSLTFQQRESLAAEIFKSQPNLLGAVLALSRHQVTYPRLEVILNILLMSFEAVRCAGLKLPLISEDVLELCLSRVVGRSQFIEGLSSQMMDEAIRDQMDQHSEKLLLALVIDELRKNEFFTVHTESEKLCVLVALNLVEVIAYVTKDVKLQAAPANW